MTPTPSTTTAGPSVDTGVGALGAAQRFVGASVPRREDPRMLTGRARYLANLPLANLTHAAFVRSDVARGRITAIDTTAALAMPGVLAVYTAADLNPGCGPLWATMYEGAAGPPSRPLADGDVRFVGDAVALVVATTAAAAADACDLVEVSIEPLDPVIGFASALRDAPVVHPERGTNIATRVDALDDAAWDAIVASAAHVVTRRFAQRRAVNVPMEGRAIIASWDPWAPQLQVWSSTQNAHEMRAACARLLSIPEHHVRVICGDVGGGFGLKIYLSPDEAAVVLAAHRLGRPVRWVEGRREHLLASGHARVDDAEAAIALDADGRILGVRVDHVEDVGAFPLGSTSSSTGGVRRYFPAGYRIGSLHYRGRALYTNTCGRVAYRGPWLFETIVREQLLDHAARALGLDPVDLRLRNMISAADQPFTTATGSVVRDISPSETLRQAAEMIGYDTFRDAQVQARAEGRCIGVGFATFVEPTGMGAGTLGTDQATLRIEPSGVVNVYLGTGSTGNSLETTIPQIVADHLGCALHDVVFHQGDTDSSPWGHGSGGSRAAVVSGGAARAASIALRERVVTIAADLLEAAPEDLEVAGSVVSVRGTPTRALRFSEIAAVAHRQPERIADHLTRTLETAVRFRPEHPVTFSNAAHACIVEVDLDTAAVRVLRYVVSEDCGTIINPAVVDGQITGGVVQGISGALYEQFVYDEHGNPLTSTLAEYQVPSAAELPSVEIRHIETPSANPGGFKGMGEGGAIGAPAAVANAVADALAHLGVAPTTLPITPSELCALLHGTGT